MQLTRPQILLTMIPIQYIIPASLIDEALAAGCRWIQTDSLSDNPAQTLHDCHAAGCYLVLADDVEAARDAAADGVFLTEAGIARTAAQREKPSGIVLQSPKPISTALHAAREMLGEDSPQLAGAWATTAADAITAAKAGADYVQLPAEEAATLAAEIRRAGCNVPLVARFGADWGFTNDAAAEPTGRKFDAAYVLRLLDAGINGIACTAAALPCLSLPLLLHADETEA